jgi:hypothetical protein
VTDDDDEGLLASIKDAVGLGDDDADEAQPADDPDETVRVQADESPADPEPTPSYEATEDDVEPGLLGLLLRAGDYLAWHGDRWEAELKDEPQQAPTPPPPEVWVGTFTLLGEQIPWNMHGWSPRLRHGASLISVGLASLLVLLGIIVELAVGAPTWFLTVLLVGVTVTLAFQLAVFLTDETQPEPVAAPEPEPEPAAAAAGAGGAAWGEVEAPGEEPEPEPEPEPAAPADEPGPLDILTLKCSECGEVFDVEDHGERPLTHTCPGCGADGEIPTSELPDPADLRDEEPDADEPDEAGEPDAPAGDIPEETGDPIPEFNLDDEPDEDQP